MVKSVLIRRNMTPQNRGNTLSFNNDKCSLLCCNLSVQYTLLQHVEYNALPVHEFVFLQIPAALGNI